MQQTLTLLQLSIVGCRDAAANREPVRALSELEFSNKALKAVQAPASERLSIVQEGLDELCRRSTASSDEVLTFRLDLYSKIANQIGGGSNGDLVRDRAEILDAIQIGQALIADALSKGDVKRAEFEADHVHNLPSLLNLSCEKSRTYYLEIERRLYLDRVEENYGAAAKNVATARFALLWAALEKSV